MVGPPFDQSIFQGEFGEVSQFVALLLFGEAVYDVEGLLLSLIDAKSFETLSLFDWVIGVGHIDVVEGTGRA